MTDFDEFVKQYHNSLQAFVNGNPKPTEELYSHGKDVSLANPFGGIMHGWESVKKTLESAASHYSGGTHSFENVVMKVSSDFGFIVEVEKFEAKLGSKAEMPNHSLRVTTIFQKENGVWKCIHRHADSLISIQRPDSVIKKYEAQKQ